MGIGWWVMGIVLGAPFQVLGPSFYSMSTNAGGILSARETPNRKLSWRLNLRPLPMCKAWCVCKWCPGGCGPKHLFSSVHLSRKIAHNSCSWQPLREEQPRAAKHQEVPLHLQETAGTLCCPTWVMPAGVFLKAREISCWCRDVF